MRASLILVLMFMIERANAAEFEKAGSAIASALGSPKAFQKKFKNDKGQDITVFYSKGSSGSPDKLAFLEKGLYNPGECTHTWVIGLNATTQTVQDVRVVEMSCTHAHPTRAASYISQYKGKGPADVKKLKDKIKTIAKATGSSDLMTEAVQRSIENAVQIRGKL
jgi:hypothetical protein